MVYKSSYSYKWIGKIFVIQQFSCFKSSGRYSWCIEVEKIVQMKKLHDSHLFRVTCSLVQFQFPFESFYKTQFLLYTLYVSEVINKILKILKLFLFHRVCLQRKKRIATEIFCLEIGKIKKAAGRNSAFNALFRLR